MLVGAIIGSAVVLGAGTTALAGEVNGNGEQTPIRDRAHSACAFSGLEDGVTLVGFDAAGNPIFATVPTGPGLVQNPHMENAAGTVFPPGLPGELCRGNVATDQ
ncbi:MAG: hypothetical protein AB7W59_01310 [Acidimicrobiia bacterium]